jgi:hypothetical protein
MSLYENKMCPICKYRLEYCICEPEGELQKEIEKLREEWKKATPAHQKLVEIRGKLLAKKIQELHNVKKDETEELIALQTKINEQV